MTFVNQLACRRFSTSKSALSSIIQNVVVIGGGFMGTGIAQVAAETGHKVTLVDISQEVLNKSDATITDNIKKVAKKRFKEDTDGAAQFIDSSLSNINTDITVDKDIVNADLVIEAVVENMGLKQKLFKEYDSKAPYKTIFASNTSSLPIADIASVTNRPDRFGGLHFFCPVPLMKLLEVVRIPETSDETFSTIVAWGKAMKKETVNCKDTPGFIVNRLLVPYLMEAIRLVERGDASAKDVDMAMKLGAGHVIGPFELADYVGLDVCKFIIDGWSERYPENSLFRQSNLLNKQVSEGKLGRKTGEGFFKY